MLCASRNRPDCWRLFALRKYDECEPRVRKGKQVIALEGPAGRQGAWCLEEAQRWAGCMGWDDSGGGQDWLVESWSTLLACLTLRSDGGLTKGILGALANKEHRLEVVTEASLKAGAWCGMDDVVGCSLGSSISF